MRSVVRGIRQASGRFEVATSAPTRLIVEPGAYDRPGQAGGPAPMELMLASLVTCAGTTIDAVLAKMRFEVSALNVVADGTRATTVPRVFTNIELEYQVASDAPRHRLARAIEVTERTCSASAMIGAVAAVVPRLIQVKTVDAVVTRALRRAVLRPHQSVSELEAEEHPDATWFGAIDDEEDAVGSVSVGPEPSPDVAADKAFRIRAMATTDAMRGRGLGAVLLAAALEHARGEDAEYVWCSARSSAQGFYRRAGFAETSDLYDVEHIGEHVRMALRL
ncbi:MAG: OsmC family protein [Acidimicrobiia bacterium]